ncbi:hypothetical protein [Stackebrandtia soli]|uniref:hypothetical protein n=1 Tax=Stackebrandtia soli TaxID=1892856 RepID=UPI0039ED5C4B
MSSSGQARKPRAALAAQILGGLQAVSTLVLGVATYVNASTHGNEDGELAAAIDIVLSLIVASLVIGMVCNRTGAWMGLIALEVLFVAVRVCSGVYGDVAVIGNVVGIALGAAIITLALKPTVCRWYTPEP